MNAKDMSWPFDADRWAKFIARCQTNFDLGCHPIICGEDVEYFISQALAADAELTRLREAVEWALSHGTLHVYKSSSQGQTSAQWVEDISVELRRRMEGKG